MKSHDLARKLLELPDLPVWFEGLQVADASKGVEAVSIELQPEADDYDYSDLGYFD